MVMCVRFKFCATANLLRARELKRHSDWARCGGVASYGNFAEARNIPHGATRALLAARIHGDFLRGHLPDWLGNLAV